MSFNNLVQPKAKPYFKYVISVLLLVPFIMSCVTSKKLKMLDGETSVNTFTTIDSVYELQTGDVLDVKVLSVDGQSVAIFNSKLSIVETRQTTTAALYIDGYEVDEEGNVVLPMIGSLLAKGLTMSVLTDSIHNRLLKYYKFVSVRVKLTNFSVSVLGEVNRPGQFYVYDSKLTILDALSRAGGIGDFGNRKKLFLVRRTGAKIEKIKLDLHDPSIIASKYYYCLPNDVIYVEPDKSKATHINLPVAALVISSLSFVLLVFNIINTK